MSLRVLVVDDCHDTADSLAVILRRSGHTVRTAYSGGEAIVISAEFQPEVLLVDVAMPGLTGIDAVRKIRANPAIPPTMVVAITGLIRVPDFPEALLCLPKPVDPEDVLRVLRQCEELCQR